MSQLDSRPQDSWVIGSADDCDLKVPEPTVSGHHCRLTHQGNGFTLQDLGSTNGTFVNGVKVAPGDPVWVPHGAQVTLGSRVQMPWPVAANASPARAATTPLAPLPGGSSGARTITIGRSPESDVQIDLPIVSWNHAVITQENGQYIIEDRNSTQRNLDWATEQSHPASCSRSRSGCVPGILQDCRRATALPREEGGDRRGQPSIRSAFAATPWRSAATRSATFRLQFPMVSWRHARLTRTPEGILVEDLGSRNGTYVNGVRISGKVLVKPGQEIGLGSFRFQLLEGGELAQREYYGNVTIEANEHRCPRAQRQAPARSASRSPSFPRNWWR